VCRYNFEAATSSTLPPKETASIPTPVTTATPNLHAKRLDVVVRVDPSLYTDPDPNLPCPIGSVDQLFPIDLAENLIGRRSGSRGIFPEISLDDPGVSHRHAKLFLEGGALWVLDLGSTNGTRLNGVDLKPGVKTELKLGDFVTLGCWTRLIFRER
jgi:pSer/pThr/pTyr-binding forkhead associated (FHA) protein